MATYKLTDEEFDQLKRWEDARKTFLEASQSMGQAMANFIAKSIAPKLGINKGVAGTVTEMSVDFKAREVRTGLSKPEAGILVPKKDGEIRA